MGSDDVTASGLRRAMANLRYEETAKDFRQIEFNGVLLTLRQAEHAYRLAVSGKNKEDAEVLRSRIDARMAEPS